MRFQELNGRVYALSAASLAAAFLCVRFLLHHFEVQSVVLLLGCTALLAVCIVRTARGGNRRERILALILACAFSAAQIVGSRINLLTPPFFNGIRRRDLFAWVAMSAALFFVLAQWFRFCAVHGASRAARSAHPRVWLAVFLILALAWLPYYLSYYPGNFSNDTFNSLSQTFSMKLNNNHPVLFTFLVGGFARLGLLLGDITLGIGLFSACQMLLLAAVLGYCVYWLYRKGVSPLALTLCTAFFALNPVVAMCAIALLKDVSYSACMLLFALLLYDVSASEGAYLDVSHRGGLGRLIILCTLLSFLRNGSYYMIVAVMLVLLIKYRLQRRRLLAAAIAMLVLIPLVQIVGYRMLGVRSAAAEESLGVPIQQIAYTVIEDGEITPQQEAFLSEIIPVEDIPRRFTPGLVDTIKFYDGFNSGFLAANKREFLRVWMDIFFVGKRNMLLYGRAWLMQTVGYYYVPVDDYAYNLLDYTESYTALFKEENTFGIVGKDLIRCMTGRSMQGLLHTICTADDVPVLGLCFNCAAMIWFFALSCATVIAKRQTRALLPALPFAVFFLGLMLVVPIYVCLRYLLMLHMALPFLCLQMFRGAVKAAGDFAWRAGRAENLEQNAENVG